MNVFRAMPSLALVVLLVSGGCARLPVPEERADQAERLALASGWRPITLDTSRFPLRAFGPEVGARHPILTVYIEGDGLAWITRTQPSNDPTPVRPAALHLALADPSHHQVYLARPCQYISNASCLPRFWLSRRFSADIVDALGEALDELKSRYHSGSLLLIGYSGGGALATLLAAERADIAGLVTVAGNLDHVVWTRHHRISPLQGSLNPADFAPALARIPQWHFSGAKDQVIPQEVTGAYLDRLPDSAPATHIVEGTFNHHCCWVESWPRLISRIRAEMDVYD